MMDRAQKASALRYAVGKRWFPQLEVEVLPRVNITTRSTAITDVDVLAAVPDEFVGFRTVLIDCKTKRSESPIARTLWLSGLIRQLNAARAICILKRPRVEPDHRLVASQHGIVLLTEDEFAAYAVATGVRRDAVMGHSAEIELWEAFATLKLRHQRLAPAVEFSKHGYWSAEDPGQALRRTIVLAARLAPELDPAKPEHIAIVARLSSLFLHALALVIARFFPAHLHPQSKDDLAKSLLLLLFGGRESYEFRAAARNLVRGAQTGDVEGTDLTLPEWERFIQIFRGALEAPNEASRSPLLLLETAWSVLAAGHSASPDLTFAKQLASESLHGARIGLLGTEYLCKASRLPPEFAEALGAYLLNVQVPNGRRSAGQPVQTKSD